MIELKTLGRGTVFKDGAELAGLPSQRQQFALLVYLAVEGRVTRDHLVAIFWPDREEERARHSLSQALYALRRELPEGCLHVEGDSVSLSGDLCSVDVRQLESAVGQERWDVVVSHYTGPFLDQFVLSGAPEFEKWQTANRARLSRLARNAFRRAVEQRMAEGKHPDALATASRWATLQPLEDEAQHTLITLLARSGDRSGALKQYDVYRILLARELDVEPLDGTVALVERIKGGAIPEYRPLSGKMPVPAPARLDERPGAPEGGAEPAPEPLPLSMAVLLSELRQRRVFHVGAAYLAVAWLAIQFTGTLVEHAILPDWVFRVVLFFLFIGFPFAVILAWARETHEGPGISVRRIWPQWVERIRAAQVFWVLSTLVLTLMAAWFVVDRRLGGTPLDESRIVVFPLSVTPEGNEALGEQLATLVGVVLESSGRVRYVDGWYSLAELGRPDPSTLSRRMAISRTRAVGAAYYVQGRILLTADSAQLTVELHDVAGDSVMAREFATTSMNEGWQQRESTSIAQRLLAALSPGEPLDVTVPSDTPQAVTEFLLGESAYRRAKFRLALDHYQRAIALDSTFAEAALKGYLAATWTRETAIAGELLEAAAGRRVFLEPSKAWFQRGLDAFWEGRADEAVQQFQQALTIAPDWPEGWAQLGETYYHFISAGSPLDSLAEAAFLEARRHDANFAPALYHLIQITTRKGDLSQAAQLAEEFRRLEPDTTSDLLPTIELMLECMRHSPVVTDWREFAEQNPVAVYQAAQAFAVGGRQSECARSAWTALLDHDAGTDDARANRHLWALLGLQSLLVAEGRYDDAASLLDADTMYAYMMGDIYILNAVAGANLEAQAREAAATKRQEIADGQASYFDLWFLGIWDAHEGRVDEAMALADSLATITRQNGDRIAGLMAQSVEARATLASGDSTAAMELLRQLVPNKRRTDYWWPWESLPGESLAFAELLYANGDVEEALRIANNMDAPARPVTDLIYLPASLALRLRIARQLGDAGLEQRCRERLSALGRSDLITDPSD